ncbi:MAG TPA: hypothetical protein VLL08_19540 [Kineosporiaceae bacterium]|nr:hypothetical protein [Kineosporiaceae bacterium]
MSADRLYQLLLRTYPRDYAAVHGGELLATLEQSSGGRIRVREVTGLLVGSVRQRWLQDRLRQPRATVTSAVWPAVLVLLGFDFMFNVASALHMLPSPSGPSAILQSWVVPASMLPSLLLFALALLGHPRPALLFALASYLLPLVRDAGAFSWSDLTPVVSLHALTLAALAITTVRRKSFSAGSWGWLLPPALLGFLATMPSPVAGIALGTALALLAIVAVCEARFALALVPLCFAMACSYLTQWWTHDSYPGSNFVALCAAIAAGVGLVFLLRAGLVLKPRQSAASK